MKMTDTILLNWGSNLIFFCHQNWMYTCICQCLLSVWSSVLTFSTDERCKYFPQSICCWIIQWKTIGFEHLMFYKLCPSMLFHVSRTFLPPSIVTHISWFYFKLYWNSVFSTLKIFLLAVSCSLQSVCRSQSFSHFPTQH